MNAAVSPRLAPPYPRLSEVRAATDEAVETAAMLALGMRRLSADLSFVRLLMYYGSAEDEEAELLGRARDPWEPPEHHHSGENGEGNYPQFLARSMRVLDRDPYFTFSALYSAGALAFNLQRTDQALAVLRRAAEAGPKEWKFRAYMAAVGFHKDGDPARVYRELSTVVWEPDCPVMIRNIVAFLARRAGRRDEAARLYRAILEGGDASYHPAARQALLELEARP